MVNTHDHEMRDLIIRELAARGVTVEEMGKIAYELQRPYNPHLGLATCIESVERVLEKREIQYAVLTGLVLDAMAEKGQLPEPLATIIRRDDSLYGVDELLGLGITNIYGQDPVKVVILTAHKCYF